MKVAFCDLARIYQTQASEISEQIQNVLNSGWYLLGKQCSEFEEEIKKVLFTEGGGGFVGCNSGTDALILSLIASGVGPGDEVITVAHTAIPTIAAIVATGATPVFVDIDARTWVMDVNLLESSITPRTKAIIPVHLYGNLVDVDGVYQTLERINRLDISVIEDVAQAQGSKLKGRQTGSMGRFGAFSFYPTKNLGALGDGGGISCRNQVDVKALKSLRFYGQESRYNANVKRGINSRLDEIQAAALRIRLRKFIEWSDKKQKQVDVYRSQLKGLPVEFQQTISGAEPAWHLFVIKLQDETARNALMNHLVDAEIETIIHYPIPTYRQISFKEYFKKDLHITDQLAKSIISLPMNPCLTEVEQEYIIRSVRSYFGN